MLDERKEKAITALMIGEGPTAIAKNVGVSRTTIYAWLEEPEFKKELDVRRKEIVEDGNNYVMATTRTHLEVIHNLAVNSTDKRVAASCAMYLVDRSLGKPTTKLETDNKNNNMITVGLIDDNELEIELNRFKELNRSNK